jgi:hypothetical protein
MRGSIPNPESGRMGQELKVSKRSYAILRKSFFDGTFMTSGKTCSRGLKKLKEGGA